VFRKGMKMKSKHKLAYLLEGRVERIAALLDFPGRLRRRRKSLWFYLLLGVIGLGVLCVIQIYPPREITWEMAPPTPCQIHEEVVTFDPKGTYDLSLQNLSGNISHRGVGEFQVLEIDGTSEEISGFLVGVGPSGVQGSMFTTSLPNSFYAADAGLEKYLEVFIAPQGLNCGVHMSLLMQETINKYKRVYEPQA
jgi:hypothetical protein